MPAGPHFHDAAAQGPAGLPHEQVLRQFPRRGGRDLLQAPAAGPTAAAGIPAGAQERRGSVRASCSVRVDAELVQQLVRQLRQADRLDVLDVERRLDRLAGQGRVGDVSAERDVDRPLLAGLGALDLLAELLGDAVLERQLRSTRSGVSLISPSTLVAVRHGHVGDRACHRRLGLAVLLGHDLAVRRQQPVFFLVRRRRR